MIETSNEVPPISVVMTFFSPDRKSTRLNSSHLVISYAVFCLKKKKIDSDLDILAISDVSKLRGWTRIFNLLLRLPGLWSGVTLSHGRSVRVTANGRTVELTLR